MQWLWLIFGIVIGFLSPFAWLFFGSWWANNHPKSMCWCDDYPDQVKADCPKHGK